MGPSEFLGPVLSRPVPGPSRDFPGRDSPAGKPSMYVLVPYFADCFFYVLSLCRISEGLPVEKKVIIHHFAVYVVFAGVFFTQNGTNYMFFYDLKVRVVQ